MEQQVNELWFQYDDDLEKAIRLAIVTYKEKFNIWPNTIVLNPSMAGLRIVTETRIPVAHFALTVRED